MCISKIQKTILKIIIIVVLPSLTWSCLTYYDVRVNGYTGGKLDIQSHKTITIVRNPKAQNPLLEEEIATKLSKSLMLKGYLISDDANSSEYILFFNYGIESGGTRTYSYEGTRLNVFTRRLEPTTEVGSESVYRRHLILNLYKLNGFTENSKPVWVGEAYSTGSSSDLRKVIDFLIRGAIEHFGKDTGSAKTHRYIDE